MSSKPGLSRWTQAYLGLVLFSLLGSVACRLARVEPGLIAPVSAFLTLLVGAAAVFSPALDWRIVAVLVLGTAVEWVGVTTGYPFGRYAYTDQWRPVIAIPGGGWFPLAAPLAWLMMSGASAFTVARYRLPPWLTAPLAGLLAAVTDLVMEPAMVGKLGYWKWLSTGPLPGGAPILNFAGWFFTATLASAILLPSRRTSSIDAPVVLGGHVLLVLGIVAMRS